MATCQDGYGTLAFGTVLVGVFRQEDGLQKDNGTASEVNCTADTDANMVWQAGDLIDYGQVKATLLIEAGVDINALIGTTETLTVTSADGDTDVGDAFLVSGPSSATPNVAYTAALTFRWESKPAFTAAP